jgi:predicted enzyme related to lactoylglutathione lyase
VVNSHGHFVWYQLMTTDVEAAKAFYAGVMGWRARDVSLPDTAFALCSAGEAPVTGLMNLPEPATAAGVAPHWVGYVGVNDIDAATNLVKRRDGTVYVPPTEIPNTSRFSVFADPQTATLGMLESIGPERMQPADMNAPGHVGWHELLATDPETALGFYGTLFGWQKANADIGPMGTYQRFSAGGQTIGGILIKPPSMPAPCWLYYFNVADIDAAAERVTAAGGQIIDERLPSPGGAWIVQCADPQGAVFALAGGRGRKVVGYFERVSPRDPSDTRSRRWSW